MNYIENYINGLLSEIEDQLNEKGEAITNIEDFEGNFDMLKDELVNRGYNIYYDRFYPSNSGNFKPLNNSEIAIIKR